MSPLEPPLPGYEVLGSGPVSSDPASDKTSDPTTGDGWLLTVRIPEPSPLFAGHFPGHPILPGVAQLALVTRALGDWRGPGMALSGVRSLKLRQPVGPGDTLVVRLSPPAEDGSVPFVIDRQGTVVSRGTVLTREAAAWP
jgi:3-hydroxyacyl-[acyl-carrier-protein] dehydratase